MTEELIQARDGAKFAASDLRAALGKAGAVEALVLLPLIADAERLAQAVTALLEARGGR